MFSSDHATSVSDQSETRTKVSSGLSANPSTESFSSSSERLRFRFTPGTYVLSGRNHRSSFKIYGDNDSIAEHRFPNFFPMGNSLGNSRKSNNAPILQPVDSNIITDITYPCDRLDNPTKKRALFQQSPGCDEKSASSIEAFPIIKNHFHSLSAPRALDEASNLDKRRKTKTKKRTNTPNHQDKGCEGRSLKNTYHQAQAAAYRLVKYHECKDTAHFRKKSRTFLPSSLATIPRARISSILSDDFTKSDLSLDLPGSTIALARSANSLHSFKDEFAEATEQESSRSISIQMHATELEFRPKFIARMTKALMAFGAPTYRLEGT